MHAIAPAAKVSTYPSQLELHLMQSHATPGESNVFKPCMQPAVKESNLQLTEGGQHLQQLEEIPIATCFHPEETQPAPKHGLLQLPPS